MISIQMLEALVSLVLLKIRFDFMEIKVINYILTPLKMGFHLLLRRCTEKKGLDKAWGGVRASIVKKGTLNLDDAGCDMNHYFPSLNG
jgi:hypothetical protein